MDNAHKTDTAIDRLAQRERIEHDLLEKRDEIMAEDNARWLRKQTMKAIRNIIITGLDQAAWLTEDETEKTFQNILYEIDCSTSV